MDKAKQRWRRLREFDALLRFPMAVLSLVWLVLVVAELLGEGSRLLTVLGTGIWVIFLIEFTVRLLLAPQKLPFLKNNWLTVLALALPALRVFRAFRLFRAMRALRGVRLVRIVGGANRGMRALKSTLRRRRAGYVLGLTTLIVFLGAAGMRSFEPASEVQGGFTSYAHALWWTAMLVTSIGSDFWPATAEGRVLALLLSIYGLAVFGYITASFASFFVGSDASHDKAPAARAEDIARLAEEIRQLRLVLAAPAEAADRSSATRRPR